MFITSRGFEILKTLDASCALARQKLTFTVPEPSRQTVRAFLELPDRLIVPYHFGVKEFGGKHRYIDQRTRVCDVEDRATVFAGTLRDGQTKAVQDTLACLEKHKGALLNLPTGGGKTACALFIATSLRAKTLVLVHKSFLADQFRERIAQFVPHARVTQIQGDICDTSGDFVIAMIQTLVSRKYPASLFAGFKLLIFDEAHHVAAKVFSTVMFSLNFEYTLGLTATPTRRDGLDRLLHDFLGPMAHSQRTISHPSAVTVRCKQYMTDMYRRPAPYNARGDVDHVRMITAITQDTQRTQFIIGLIADDPVVRDRHILVLSHRRAHCEALVGGMVACGLDASTYLGGAKRIPESKIVVSTFSFVSEGFDQPRFDVLILSTPASDVTQAAGRVLRRLDDPNCRPIIIDIVDQWSIFFSQALKRRKFYSASGFTFSSYAILQD